ncbi:hypothetical protein LFZ43_22915 [Salmonella enterica subsp. enterica serovar Wandsworth str. SA20092095]|uniref:Hha/YmoA family nucleoid-associated regulatory protein n=1 Tax=Salmonella enterica TaxID=28901 RepID=UPI000973A648|nr:Hha/YmoA family nucleoid-associated regulatory protein [Salmonella enterica]APZ68599.1 hypothetical protein LFZ43_22915 [Salmonella enterica subsp. enterica serovar Wandsworth str. SA20092095]EDN8389000.1 hypothetical protein [Salmonella enterica subsp. enterica serovar Wandsworth]EGZ4492729.1 hypothetical protein [Salmonella enterica subsp. enterica serovar Wandsworth]
MDDADWLIVFSRCEYARELEIFINQKICRLSEYELEYCNAVADHHRAELNMGQLCDKVPTSVWKRVKQMLPDLRGQTEENK